MSTENLPAIPSQDKTLLGELSSSAAFLPRMSVINGMSQAAKPPHKMPVGNIVFIRGSQFIDLGTAVDVFPIMYQAKAMHVANEEVLGSSNDKDSVFYKKMMLLSEQPNSGAMYGPEFLLWCPTQKTFVTFFFGTKSARRAAGGIGDYLSPNKHFTLKSGYVENKKKQGWYIPAFAACSVPFDIPGEEDIKDAIAKFTAPPAAAAAPAAVPGAVDR